MPDQSGLPAAVTVTEPPWNGERCGEDGEYESVQPWLIEGDTKVRPVSRGRAVWDTNKFHDVMLSVNYDGFQESASRQWGLLCATCEAWGTEHGDGCLVTADQLLRDVC